MTKNAFATAVALAALSTLGPSIARAQPQAPDVKRTVLQKHDLAAPGEQGIMALVEIPAGGREGRHTHPAEAFVYVMDGTVTLDLEGEPTRTYGPGSTFFIPRGRIHEGMNNGTTPVKIIGVFVADKDKPLTTQAK